VELVELVEEELVEDEEVEDTGAGVDEDNMSEEVVCDGTLERIGVSVESNGLLRASLSFLYRGTNCILKPHLFS